MVPVVRGKDQQDSGSDGEEEEVIGKQPLKASRAALKKITKDGPHGGKNRQILGPDGQALSAIEALKAKHILDEDAL